MMMNPQKLTVVQTN